MDILTTADQECDCNVKEIDFTTAFQLRDRLKNQYGLEKCEAVLEDLIAKFPNSDPIRLNSAICLVERAKHEAALARLNRVSSAPLNWQPQWRKSYFFYKFVSQSYLNSTAAMNELASTLEALEPEARSDLLCGAIMANRIIRNDLVRWGEIINANASCITFSESAIKKWFETCSSNNRVHLFEAFKARLSPEQLAYLEPTFNLIDLLYGDTTDTEFQHIVSAHKWPNISDHDRYIIAIRSLKLDNHSFAADLINAFIAERPNSFILRRAEGFLEELRGNSESARRSYHDASKLELSQTGIDARAISNVDPSQVRISCITMTYNEAPLVRNFCLSIMPHCDQIVVNDGGSTDETVAEFIRIREETGFNIIVQNDVQYTNRDRTIEKKNDYRSEGRGGILGFDASRRRTTSLLAAQYDYICMIDLDERLPAVPNLKNIVAAAYGAEHFAGVKCDIRDSKGYYEIKFNKHGAAPLLFKRQPSHMFGPHTHVNGGDEYLTRADIPLTEFATQRMPLSLSNSFYIWHLKMLLDGRHKEHMDGRAGPVYPISARFDVPENLPRGGV